MTNVAAIVLCGGKGTRLHSVTEDKIPKCLVEVAGKPFLWHVLVKLATCNIKNIILAIGHHALQVKDFVSLTPFKEVVEFFDDRGIERGTGGAVRSTLQCMRCVADPTVLVLNGDTMWTGNFVVPVVASRFSGGRISCVVNLDGQCSGVYAGSYKSWEQIPYGVRCDLDTDVIGAAGNDVNMVWNASPFYDIGTPEGLQRTRDYFASKEGSK